MQFTDEWLFPTMETLVGKPELDTLRNAPGGPASLWESLVSKKLTSDDRVLAAAAERFRLPLADLTKLDFKIRESVPETLARRFNVLPLRITDSYIEVASANPFDLDAEKLLAFATGREVRMHLASPFRRR